MPYKNKVYTTGIICAVEVQVPCSSLMEKSGPVSDCASASESEKQVARGTAAPAAKRRYSHFFLGTGSRAEDQASEGAVPEVT